MRKLGAALLALPVVILLYVAVAVRSAGRFRAAGFVGAAGLIALVLMVGGRPAPSAAAPQSLTRTVSAQLLNTVVTDHSLKAPITVAFDAPMDGASVAAALRMTPEAAVSFTWDEAGRTLTIAPLRAWAPDTLYTLTVAVSARGADGSPMATPVHAVVMTARGGSGTLEVTKVSGTRAALDTAFVIHLDRAVALDALRASIRTDPAFAGMVTAGARQGDYTFTPDAPLAPNTVYQLTLAGLLDGDGVAFAAIPSVLVRTVAAPAVPAVVRFRPGDGATGQDRASVISVRFTAEMNPTTTAAAFRVTAAGKAVAGRLTWAETYHVIVFTPATALPYGATVGVKVAATATSAAGGPIAAAAGTFVVKALPAAAKKPPAPKPPAPKPIPHPSGSGGSGGVSASWYSVEVYYLNLMNCTRTGGWVTSSGSCSSPGGRNVPPLKLSAGISANVSRPYAKYLATQNLCNHFYGGTPGDRLRRAGYTSYNWGENIGCESLSPYQAVLGDHLFFQSEKPYNGGHYVNLMNSLYTEVGVGVWVSSGRVRLVIDFYRP